MANINRKFLKFKALTQQPVMAGIEKNHLGRGLNLGWQGGNFALWGPRRIFLAMCAPTFSELNLRIRYCGHSGNLAHAGALAWGIAKLPMSDPPFSTDRAAKRS